MNLAEHLARKAVNHIRANAALSSMHAEHDAWARQHGPGTYYTIRPTSNWHLPGTPYHSVLTFTEHGKGMYKGQLITDRGASSWRLWQELGPFTATRMRTAADWEAADRAAEAGEMRRAELAVAKGAGWEQEWAKAAQQYPATVRELQAA